MDTPLEIAFKNMDTSEAVERRVRERAERLEKLFRHINSCRVAVEAPHRSQKGPQRFRVRIEVRVPDNELVVSRDPGARDTHFDVYLAVRDAFDAMERQLESYAEKLRGDVKAHDAPLQGRVRRTFPDYGFIETNDGRDVYFHRNAVVDGSFDDLAEGETVELSLAYDESREGPQATAVRRIGRMEYVPERPTS